MVKIQEGKSQHWITIPKNLMKMKKWKKGTELIWNINRDGYLEIREVEE